MATITYSYRSTLDYPLTAKELIVGKFYECNNHMICFCVEVANERRNEIYSLNTGLGGFINSISIRFKEIANADIIISV